MSVFCKRCAFRKITPIFKRSCRSFFVTSKVLNYATQISRPVGERIQRATTSLVIEQKIPSVDDFLRLNVDNKEVTNHENIENWWDTDGPMMALHAMNNVRISFIRNGLLNSKRLQTDSMFLNGVKIIDIGCGGGILCEPLARLGAEVTGIDPSQDLITLAEVHASQSASSFKSNLPSYINTSVEDHSVNNVNVYDAVVASEVIEHVPNKESFLDACFKILKPGGSVFLTTPNRTNASWLGSIIVAENILRIVPKGIHDWEKFITPTELKHLSEKIGFETVLINGMFYNVLTNEWLWCDSTLLHYGLQAMKMN